MSDVDDFYIYGREKGPLPDVSGMTSPVRCRFCADVYDLATAEVMSRYADATVFVTPCCDRRADDRSWKSAPDFVRLDSQGREVTR